VGGVSIWKLARDLNEPKFFDGRLLVPETEGSESLPSRVSWDLTGLLPLEQARAEHPEAVTHAIQDFAECLDRVAKVFAAEDSGYHIYREGLTIPSMEADGGANYYFSPPLEKLFVINWGASPRSVKQEQDYLFGYQNFDLLFGRAGGEEAGDAPDARAIGGSGAKIGLGLVAGAGVAAAEGHADPAPDGSTGAEGQAEVEKQEQDEKQDKAGQKSGGRRTALIVILILVGLALLCLVLFFLLRGCQGAPSAMDGGLAGDAGSADGGAVDGAPSDGDMARTSDGDGADGSADGSATDAGATDGQVDAVAEGSDADSQGDGASQADADGQGADDGGSDDSGPDDGGGSGGGGSGGGGSGGGGSGGDTRIIIIDGRPVPVDAMGAALPHRSHFHPDAVSWRVSTGQHLVHHVEGRGTTFDVYLQPGSTFNRVQVQWQDGNGRWHNH
jgi:hypothetical protein